MLRQLRNGPVASRLLVEREKRICQAWIAQCGDQFVADPAGANISIKLDRGSNGQIKTLAAQGLVIPRDP